MKNSYKIGISLLIVIACYLASNIGFSIYYGNMENSLRNTVEAKVKDNKNQFDSMWKQISQIAQVTKEERESLNRLLTNNSQQRGISNEKLVSAWIQEAVPNVSNSTYINLQNVISSARTAFATRQTELIDLNNQHNILIQNAPSSWFLKDKKSIDITIVTSTKTENVFSTGKDDDMNVFK